MTVKCEIPKYLIDELGRIKDIVKMEIEDQIVFSIKGWIQCVDEYADEIFW